MRFYYSKNPHQPDTIGGIDPEFFDLAKDRIPTIICVPHGTHVGNLYQHCLNNKGWQICVFSINSESDVEKLMEYYDEHRKLDKAFYRSIGAKRLFFTQDSDTNYDWIQGKTTDTQILAKTLEFHKVFEEQGGSILTRQQRRKLERELKRKP